MHLLPRPHERHTAQIQTRSVDPGRLRRPHRFRAGFFARTALIERSQDRGSQRWQAFELDAAHGIGAVRGSPVHPEKYLFSGIFREHPIDHL